MRMADLLPLQSFFFPLRVAPPLKRKTITFISLISLVELSLYIGGGRVVRRYWVNSQCRWVLLIYIIVGQGPIALAVGAGGGCLDICSLVCHFSFLTPSLWETARYRLKYCLKGPLSPNKQTNQNSYTYKEPNVSLNLKLQK